MGTLFQPSIRPEENGQEIAALKAGYGSSEPNLSTGLMEGVLHPPLGWD